jgi:FixJ family two-component response regulator
MWADATTAPDQRDRKGALTDDRQYAASNRAFAVGAGAEARFGDEAVDMAARQHTIGVVDDEPGLAKALARLLRSHGYRVELFASTDDVLKGAKTSKAECLLVDLQIGERSGLGLARDLARAGFNFPIVFMSASDDDTLRQECIDFGCAGYLRKPFLEQQLMEAVAQAIGTDARRN